MSENKNLTHNSKKSFLQNPVKHIDITSFDARKIISSMEKMSFVSRETANAANIFNEMIQDKNCTIFLTLAGSTSLLRRSFFRLLVRFLLSDIKQQETLSMLLCYTSSLQDHPLLQIYYLNKSH